MIMKIITELHGGLGHESSREGRGGATLGLINGL